MSKNQNDSSPEVTHYPHEQRFVIELEGEDDAVLEYERRGPGLLDLRQTFVPESQRGNGLGGLLAKEALEYARKMNQQVVPSCPFVKSYMDENVEYNQLLH